MMPRIAIGQICSTASMSQNTQQCVTLIQKAAEAKVNALFLPEASDYIASSASESISLCQPASSSPFVQRLCAEARKHNLAINVGVHEPSSKPAAVKLGDERKKIKNTLLWIDREGKIEHRYQKLHLFDVEIEGGPVLKESDSVEAGTEILPPFLTPLGHVGLLICFDLRFPEPSLALRRMGAQIITYPSAFTVPTGKAHWSTLLKARAIETQAFIIAATQVGRHNERRVSWGHSMVVDPWGEVLAELGGAEEWEGEPQLEVVDLDMQKLERVRREMPLRRRVDVYPEV